MTDTTSTTQLAVLKTDSRGRVQTPADQRNALMDAFEKSGMSGAAFAKLHGIRYTTFAGWRQRRNRRRKKEPEPIDPAPFFEEVEFRSSRNDPVGLRVSLPGGASVCIEQADQFPMVAALLQYLERSC